MSWSLFRVTVTFLLVAISLASGALAAANVHSDDLAILSDEQLASLKDTEFDALKAEVELSRARGAAATAKIKLGEAKQKLKVEKLDLDAAKAEARAARANQKFAKDEKTSPALAAEQDSERTEVTERASTAQPRLAEAQLKHDRAEAFVAWKIAEVEATALYVGTAELNVEAAEINRDAARLAALQQADATVAARYSRLGLPAKKARAEERLAQARVRHQEAEVRQDAAKRSYEEIPSSPATRP